MSTLAYAAITTRREEADPGESKESQPPGLQTYVDAVAALVPAEVLAAHAVILPAVTTTSTNANGDSVTTISDPTTLRWVFVALTLAAVGLYVVGHKGPQERLDYVRMTIPALAFVCWTMLQKSTAFDAIAPDLTSGARTAISVLLALILGVAAARLGTIADQKTPRPAGD